MTRNELFEVNSDLFKYRNQSHDCDSVVPLTRSAVLELADLCAAHVMKAYYFNENLKVDDHLIKIVCGFIHSLDRKTGYFKIQDLFDSALKSYSNEITSIMYQESEANLRAQQPTQLTVVDNDDDHPEGSPI